MDEKQDVERTIERLKTMVRDALPLTQAIRPEAEPHATPDNGSLTLGGAAIALRETYGVSVTEEQLRMMLDGRNLSHLYARQIDGAWHVSRGDLHGLNHWVRVTRATQLTAPKPVIQGVPGADGETT